MRAIVFPFGTHRSRVISYRVVQLIASVPPFREIMEIDVGIGVVELRFNDGVAIITEDYFALSCG